MLEHDIIAAREAHQTLNKDSPNSIFEHPRSEMEDTLVFRSGRSRQLIEKVSHSKLGRPHTFHWSQYQEGRHCADLKLREG